MRRPVGFLSEQKFRNTLSHMTLQRVADKQQELQAEMAAGWESVEWCCAPSESFTTLKGSITAPALQATREYAFITFFRDLTEINVQVIKVHLLIKSLIEIILISEAGAASELSLAKTLDISIFPKMYLLRKLLGLYQGQRDNKTSCLTIMPLNT